MSMIILNKNDLNTPIRTQRPSDWIKEHDPTTCCFYKKSVSNTKTQVG